MDNQDHDDEKNAGQSRSVLRFEVAARRIRFSKPKHLQTEKIWDQQKQRPWKSTHIRPILELGVRCKFTSTSGF
jgi:hypothetical protein